MDSDHGSFLQGHFLERGMEYKLLGEMRWRTAASEKRQRENLGEQDWCPLEKKAAWYHHKRD